MQRAALMGLLLAIVGCESAPVAKPAATATTPATATTATAAASATAEPSATTKTPPAMPTAVDATAEGQAAASANTLGLAIFQRKAPPDQSFVLSPASIAIALTMTHGGAKGDTAAEMKKAMAIASDDVHGGWGSILGRWAEPNDKVELSVANRLFGEATHKFEAPFQASTKAAYGAPLEPLDFIGNAEKQRQYINGWVADATKDRIEDLIPPDGIDRDTRLVLVNAIYLKASWSKAFNPDRTADGSFFVRGSEEVKVPMMQDSRYASYAETEHAQIATLPYVKGDLEMVLVVPKEKKGLAKVTAALTHDEIASWSLKGEQVVLSLPRFEIKPGSEALELKPELMDLGMKLAFDDSQADFTGIAVHDNPADRLYIGKVYHKAFVAVDEQGTEAAAATAVTMPRAGSAAPAEPKKLVVDRPFVFLIRDAKSGTLLFVGQVTDPRTS